MPPTSLSVVALSLLVLAGFAFWPAYLSRLSEATAYTHVHAGLGTAWLLLLALQPWLVQLGQHGWHRRLGRAGVAVGAGFVVSGVLVAHASVARMTAEQLAGEGRYVYLPLAMAVMFAAALALAVRWRRSPPVHGRFMAATGLALLDPLFARLLFFYGPALPHPALHQGPAFLAILGVLLWLLRSLPRASPGRAAFRGYAIGVFVLLAGLGIVPATAAWGAFVGAFARWPLG